CAARRRTGLRVRYHADRARALALPVRGRLPGPAARARGARAHLPGRLLRLRLRREARGLRDALQDDGRAGQGPRVPGLPRPRRPGVRRDAQPRPARRAPLPPPLLGRLPPATPLPSLRPPDAPRAGAQGGPRAGLAPCARPPAVLDPLAPQLALRPGPPAARRPALPSA